MNPGKAGTGAGSGLRPGRAHQPGRIAPIAGDHPIFVAFDTLRHRLFNHPWVEGFSPVELERV